MEIAMREKEFMKLVASSEMPDVKEVKASCIKKLNEENRRKFTRRWIAGGAVAALLLCLCATPVNSMAKDFLRLFKSVLVLREDGQELQDSGGEPFNFYVSVGKRSTSDEVQKKSEVNYATVSVTSYGNTTNKKYLYIGVLRDGVAVTDLCKVEGGGKYTLEYTSNVYAGQSLALCIYTGENAVYGYGVISGVFNP